MPIQAPQWADYLNCPACCREFTPPRSPVSLGCGHTLCRLCLKNLHRKQCPFDQTVISVDLEELVVNTALLQLAGYTPPSQPYHPPCIEALGEQDRRAYDIIIKCLEQLAVFLKFCGNATLNILGSRLSRPMQRKLVTLLQCAVTDEEGRGKAARAARSLGERTVTELILQHQNPQQLSANLWAAVRARGCQFLGPSMQEEVLKLVLLALEDGSALSRKVLVMFVVQRLEPHFPQASKTSIGHVVQLLYRASCFKVSKRESDSSLMQLKEEFRTYETLRREHDAQIVQIATEAGLRIAPDQWSALLYGDTQHKSHMQSIIDKLQTPQSFSQSVQELFIALQRTGDPTQLIVMSIPLDRLANIDASPDAKNPTWQQLSDIMTSLKEVVSGLVQYMHHLTSGRDVIHNSKILDRLAEPPAQQSTMPGGMVPNRYKVAMCRDAQARTYCPRGNSCTYAHSEEELERYRRLNCAANNGNYQYLMPVMQPAIAVARPMYQRFSVPPPPLPSMDNNYNMPPMQQQMSPSARRSMIGADAPERDQSYDSQYEHPPPNVSADNYVGSYANALMQGGSDGMANQNSQQQHQNGSVNTMMPPPGRYYPRYPSERAAYPYMPRMDAGRNDNDEASQYPGIPVDQSHGDYPQQPYADENGAELHYEQLPFGITVPHPTAIAPPPESAWPNLPDMKRRHMFEFNDKAKNLPLCMDIGNSMPMGEYVNSMPIGEYGNNMQIGEFGNQMPIDEFGNNKAIGMEMTNNLPIGNNLPIAMPQTNGDMMHHGMDSMRMKPKAPRTETLKRDDQELEKELKALEQRISTEFCKTADHVEV